MNPILIFRHVEYEGPGYLSEFLDARNIPYRIINIDRGEAVPGELDNISGLVFMGGPMSVNDPVPWIAEELALIRKAHEYSLPMLGHCLGGQLISKALGGKISANPVKEIGWDQVNRPKNNCGDLFLPGLADKFEAFHWHGEMFSIPDGAELILSSQFCKNQEFVIGKTIAMQCHIEVTAAMVREWVSLFTEQLENPSSSIQSETTILLDVEKKAIELRKIADQIYSHWLKGVE